MLKYVVLRTKIVFHTIRRSSASSSSILSPVKLAKYPFFRFSSTVYKDCCSSEIQFEFSGLHYCLFVNVLGVLSPSFNLSCLRQLNQFIISSVACQALF
jgi:hypothetical protein